MAQAKILTIGSCSKQRAVKRLPMHLINDYVNKTTKRLPHRQPLGRQETEIRNLLWTELLQECDCLTSRGLRIRRGLPTTVKGKSDHLLQWIRTLGQASAAFVRLLFDMPTKETVMTEQVTYKLGTACPGRSGCTDASGQSTNLRPGWIRK